MEIVFSLSRAPVWPAGAFLQVYGAPRTWEALDAVAEMQ